ncbi:hypothetical protein EVAR_54528_1 [Eumeta japonica]|uniref:Uncharacterized protein n=1 Tax=Eumeta variegata TaxID=151549 RepID=A0A4C1YM72_EUMVA|nr:hypothetical protein EVAR_54528_1 [Eumeta japonica]
MSLPVFKTRRDVRIKGECKTLGRVSTSSYQLGTYSNTSAHETRKLGLGRRGRHTETVARGAVNNHECSILTSQACQTVFWEHERPVICVSLKTGRLTVRHSRAGRVGGEAFHATERRLQALLQRFMNIFRLKYNTDCDIGMRECSPAPSRSVSLGKCSGARLAPRPRALRR